MEQVIYTVLVALISVLGSAGAWKFYEKRMESKRIDETELRLDLKNRIVLLEKLLAESSEEKDQMRKTILDLTRQVAELATKVEFLEKENGKLIKVKK
jgi:Tfp pilus assembly protein PilO